MSHNQQIALPAEPLLDIPTRPLERVRIEAEAEGLLEDLAGEPDVASRSRALFGWLRRRMAEPGFVAALEGILAAAAASEPFGVAALASLLAVRAPGSDVIESLREFRNLHRMARRYQQRLDRGEILAAPEQELLKALQSATTKYAAVLDDTLVHSSGLPAPLDLGPARTPRLAFAAVVQQLEERGALTEAAIACFIELARLELTAAEQRAGALAGYIDPHDSHAVARTIPIVAGIDSELRDHQAFLDTLEQRGRASVFREQHPLFKDHLESEELRKLLTRVEGESRLHLARRLLLGIQRVPLPGRVLSYYVDRLLEVGRVVHEAKVRPRGLDTVEAALLALDFVRDRAVTVPVGQQVSAALQATPVTGVELQPGALHIAFDPSAARRVHAPAGLPLPLGRGDMQAAAGEDQTIKDLVMDNLNNTSVLLGLLRNAKVITAPGVVGLIASSCRGLRVLEYIAETKALHTGYANKNVPLLLLRSPSRLSLKTLRKFIHVKYVSKLELKRLSNDRTGLRREVWDEISNYLDGFD